MDLIVTHHDEAAPIAVEGMANGEGGVAAPTEFREV